MVGGEGIARRLIHGQHSHHSVQAFERNRERGLQRVLPGFHDVARFDLRIAVHDRFAVLCHPSTEAFAHPELERRQRFEIFPADQLRQEPAVAVHKYRDGIVRDHASQPHGEHGQCFAQAQRHSEILAELEHRLRFLPC